MNILLIHGEDSIASRNVFLGYIESANQKGYKVTDISNSTNLDLSEKLTSQSLFEEKIVLIHDKMKNIKPKDVKWIKDNSQKYEADIIFYSDSIIPAKIISSFPKKIKTEKFDLPKIIFQFLDSFIPGNANKALLLLNKLLENQPIELVFAMLGRHLKDLIWVKMDPDNLPKYPSWRIKKIESQSDKFSDSQLKKIINHLSEADIKSKTSDNSLKAFLDLIIVTQLK